MDDNKRNDSKERSPEQDKTKLKKRKSRTEKEHDLSGSDIDVLKENSTEDSNKDMTCRKDRQKNGNAIFMREYLTKKKKSKAASRGSSSSSDMDTFEDRPADGCPNCIKLNNKIKQMEIEKQRNLDDQEDLQYGENMTLKRDLKKAAKKLKIKEDEIQDLNEENADLQTKATQSKKLIKEYKSKIKSLEENIEDKENEIIDIQKDVNKVETLKSTIKDKDCKIKDLLDEVNKLQEEVKGKESIERENILKIENDLKDKLKAMAIKLKEKDDEKLTLENKLKIEIENNQKLSKKASSENEEKACLNEKGQPKWWYYHRKKN